MFLHGEEGIYPILQGKVRLKADRLARLRGEMENFLLFVNFDCLFDRLVI